MLVFLLMIMCGSFCNPIFIDAKETCYVDYDADNDGDGSKDEPYQKISKALSKDCKKIIVEKGTYKDDIILNKSVTLEGEGSVTITGKVTMKDGSKIEEVTVSGKGGIEIDDDADVEIEDVKITGASIGIETFGRGTLTVKDAKIIDNGKGLYIQAGKNIKITNSEVSDNSEEGIDIRANVDGTISGNTIHDNGESGIEVILGKSELLITNNSIKKNHASGIAAQYYEHASKIGAVKITGNTITDNKDFGINCKAPSGGNPGVDYWSASTNMTSNKVSGNKNGDFAPACAFSANTVSDATMTKEQKEQEAQKQQLRIAEIAQKNAENKMITAQEEEQKAQEELYIAQQKQKDLQGTISDRYEEVQKIHRHNVITQEKINNRNAVITFIIGLDQDELQNISASLEQYDQKIMEAQAAQHEVKDGQICDIVTMQIDQMKKQREEMSDFVQEKRSKFNIFYWLFNKEK